MASEVTDTVYFTSAAPVTSVPITMSAWVYVPAPLANIILLQLRQGTSDVHDIQYNTFLGLVARSLDGGVNQGISSFGAGFTADTWHHIAGVFSSTANRQVFLNGTGSTPNTTNVNVATLDTLTTGRFASGSTYLADVTLWNTALTQADITSLAKGFSSSRVKPESIVFHAPLVRDRKELTGGLTLTDVGGTPQVQPHPPIIGALPV